MIFVALLLGAALAAVLLKMRSQQRAISQLSEALEAGKPFLQDTTPGGSASRWQQLVRASNAVINELAGLKSLQAGQLSQLQATLDTLQEAVLMVDANNYVLLSNGALREIFPRATDILGQRLELALRNVDFLEYTDRVRQGTAEGRKEIQFVEHDHSIWVEVSGKTVPPLEGHPGPWMLFVLHDLTHRKRLESVRKDFVANVSHELRTPLSIIKGYVETLVDTHEQMSIEDRDRFLRTVQRHAGRLHELLEDLLMLSRLESLQPGLKPERIELGGLLQQIVEDHANREMPDRHPLTLALDPHAINVVADPLRLVQICDNLIDNALKHTPPGTPIEISTGAGGPGEVMICVTDTGPGIQEEDLPHIFERFYRADKGRSRETGGTGLGLSITKHLVQLHGGRIWAESAPGQGSRFCFTLPDGSGAAFQD